MSSTLEHPLSHKSLEWASGQILGPIKAGSLNEMVLNVMNMIAKYSE
jgi:hypothetical protein